MNARHSMPHPLLLAALVVSLPLAPAGCGNKGPLVMAAEPAEIEATTTPEGSVPAEIAAPQAPPSDAPAAPSQPHHIDPRRSTAPATVPQTLRKAPGRDRR